MAYNTWSQKAPFPSSIRRRISSFTIGTKAFVVGGTTTDSKQFYEYNSLTNTWQQRTDYPGLAGRDMISFSINNFGYTGLGSATTAFYKWDDNTGQWSEKTAGPSKIGAESATTLNNTTGYVFCAYQYSRTSHSYVDDTWTQLEDYPNLATGIMYGQVWNDGTNCFHVGGLTYAGFIALRYCYRYNVVGNTWTQRASITTVYEGIYFGVGKNVVNKNAGVIGAGFGVLSGNINNAWCIITICKHPPSVIYIST